MYLRGYDPQNESLIGHNSLGVFNPELLVDMDTLRRLSYFQIEVAHLELMTGTQQDKKDYFFSNAKILSDGSYAGNDGIHFKDGCVFSGDVNQNGKPEGKGKMTWPDESFF